jgi:hypothetical protein
MNQAKLFLILWVLLLCVGCANNSSEKQKNDCPIPPPEAIFKKEVATISDHMFKLNGRNSEESLTFADSTKVTIYQSGCDKITQEYRFDLPASMSNPNKVLLAVNRLNYMAQLGPDYMTFGAWSSAIEGLQDQFMRENTVMVEPGFYVSLDKLESGDRSTLIIKLFQK